MMNQKIHTMQRLFGIILLSGILLSNFTGCKTTEENYRKAYERALTKKNEGLSAEQLEAISREESEAKTVVNGVSIPMRTRYVNAVKTEVSNSIEKYNVVVGGYKQKFNGLSVLKRLKEAGYDRAALMIDGDQQYYVAAETTNSLDSAITALNNIVSGSSSIPFPVKTPYPYILRRP